MQYKLLNYQRVKELCEKIFEQYGFSQQEAATITEVLLMADLYGIESHGIQRLIRYHNAMKSGEVEVGAELEIVHETPISATIDAHKAMGQLAARRSMEIALEKARACGIGLVAVRCSNHYGIAGYYAKMAADEDMLGVSMTNTEAIMVPTFGRKAMLGTNPIAVAMPADPRPFLFDAATTVVPRGKLEVYNKRGDALPDQWVLDENGGDSTDAGAVLHNIIHKLGGGIAPLGGTGERGSGYKGYGFGLICELFTSIMAGGPTSPHCVTPTMNSLSHCFWAIDYGIFGNKADIRTEFSKLLDDLRHSPKAQGQERIYIHGEKELESYEKNLEQGIPVNEKTFNELRDISAGLGLNAQAAIGDRFE